VNTTEALSPSDAIVYRVAQLFIGDGGKRPSTADIAEQVSREFPKHERLTREAIYPLVGVAVSRGFMKLVPPVDQQLAANLCARYPNLQQSTVRVVETAGAHDNAKVATVAAELAMEYTREIARIKGGPVGLGLGPGRATLDFCVDYIRLLRGCTDPVKLKLVAISAGCPAEWPDYSSISFFNLFPKHRIEPRHGQVGLFAETLVPQKDFEEIKKRPGVKEAFAARDSIDVVVTSMGDANDEDDLLSVFLKQSGKDLNRLRASGWVGNVQYRPYTLHGPVEEKPNDLRAVTLFELADLARIANQKHKHVVLIGRQCGQCQRTRAEALRPLLTEPTLKVFSTLVLDAATAVDLLK